MRPSPAGLGVVRVGSDFASEFPDADASSTEAYASLVRTGTALTLEIDRCLDASFDLPHPAATALAVIEGAERPLTPTEISERMLIPSATMTATLDLLERLGWIERQANPDDRRSLHIAITQEGRAMADRLLPGIRTLERDTMAALTPKERGQLLHLLEKVLSSAAEIAQAEPIPLKGRRNRPKRSS